LIQACEYKHPNFKNGRRDLLEQISRQQSAKPNDKHEHPVVKKDISEQLEPIPKFDVHVDSLTQGQKLAFYHLKDLERRVDFFERELANCFYIVESQARLIKELLFNMPHESRVRVLICSTYASRRGFFDFKFKMECSR
jgi:hypothetical protein